MSSFQIIRHSIRFPHICAILLCAGHLGAIPSALGHGGELEEIVVTALRNNRTLDDTPLRVEILGTEELREKANMKPGDIRMLLNESTGIQVQQTSPTSFNSSIRIQGLDGRYTQLLRDGLPIYAGFSGSLSLLQITPLDLEQVEVVKGASSTLYGGGAIAGLVNLVSKTPGDSPENAVMINATSARGLDASAFHSSRSGQHGAVLFATYNRSEAYDPADNGLTAIPQFERVTLTPRWFYTVADDTSLDIGLGFIEEERLGGSIDYVDGNATGDYFEVNDSRRAYTRLGLFHRLDSSAEVTVKSTYSLFDRSLAVPGFTFSGEQTSSFSELAVTGGSTDSSWVAGLNIVTEKFDQNQPASGFEHDYSERTAGLFGQYTKDLSSRVVIEGGLRADHHSEYGSFILPRLSVLYLPGRDLTLRFGGGYGYKAPSLFVSDAERINYKNIIPIDPSTLDAETSRGLSFDINHRYEFADERSLTSNALLFYTRIDDLVELEERSGLNVFDQINGHIDTQGIETNLILQIGEMRYFLGYTYVDATLDSRQQEAQLPLISRHRVNQVLVWEREDDFRIGLEAYYFSSQQRDSDADGKSYWIFGLMTEKRLSDGVTMFLNFENFTDTRQTGFESINTGTLQSPEFRETYAPLDGFVVNGGFRIRW